MNGICEQGRKDQRQQNYGMADAKCWQERAMAETRFAATAVINAAGAKNAAQKAGRHV